RSGQGGGGARSDARARRRGDRRRRRQALDGPHAQGPVQGRADLLRDLQQPREHPPPRYEGDGRPRPRRAPARSRAMTARRHALAAAVALAPLLLPSQAAAHAFLTRSDPADGARLASPPRRIRLEFSESISRTLSRATLTGARTGRVAGVKARSSSDRSFVVSLPKLRRDTYVLDWLTVSQDDLH